MPTHALITATRADPFDKRRHTPSRRFVAEGRRIEPAVNHRF